MPQIKPNNPAARLYLILERLWKTYDNDTFGQGWIQALDHKGTDIELRTRIGMVYGLPGEVQKLLQRRLDYDPSEMAWWEDMTDGFMQNRLNEPWAHVKQNIGKRALDELRLRAILLNRIAPEPYFDNSILSELREYVGQVREALEVDLDDDEELSYFLSQRLDAIESLLDDVQIVGVAAVEIPLKQAAEEVKARTDDIHTDLKPEVRFKLDSLLLKVYVIFLVYNAFLLKPIENTANTITAISSAVVKTREALEGLGQTALPEAPKEPKENNQPNDSEEIPDADFKPAENNTSTE